MKNLEIVRPYLQNVHEQSYHSISSKIGDMVALMRANES